MRLALAATVVALAAAAIKATGLVVLPWYVVAAPIALVTTGYALVVFTIATSARMEN